MFPTLRAWTNVAARRGYLLDGLADWLANRGAREGDSLVLSRSSDASPPVRSRRSSRGSWVRARLRGRALAEAESAGCTCCRHCSLVCELQLAARLASQLFSLQPLSEALTLTLPTPSLPPARSVWSCCPQAPRLAAPLGSLPRPRRMPPPLPRCRCCCTRCSSSRAAGWCC